MVRELPPDAERQRLLEAVIFGMALADKAIREQLAAMDFQYPLAAMVDEIQKPKPEMWKVDGWLRDQLSVERASGVKVFDACLERLKRNAAFRDLKHSRGYEATALQIKELLEMRKRTAEDAKRYREWLASLLKSTDGKTE